MKIGQFEPKTPPVSTPATQADRKGGAAANGGLEPSAKVALSSNATVSGSNEASFDQAKVDRIAQAIQDGQFKIDAGAIADRLIANAQELLGRGTR